jgi:YebC/PmpR family DNA-binding regulatory protein
MSGHSKWSTIKRKKGANDLKRGQIFTKLIKEIIAAARQGGTSVEHNTRLRVAVQNAKSANTPKENIERAILKADAKNCENYINVSYEGYGPYGVAIFVECITDNLNRTVAFVRSVFNKFDGALGKNGSLNFLFQRLGIFEIVSKSVADKDDFILLLIEQGAYDVNLDDDVIYVECSFENFSKLHKLIESLNIETISAELVYQPNDFIELDGDAFEKINNLINVLEDNDDVQNVFHNMKIK